jgi:hypothetical protein
MTLALPHDNLLDDVVLNEHVNSTVVGIGCSQNGKNVRYTIGVSGSNLFPTSNSADDCVTILRMSGGKCPGYFFTVVPHWNFSFFDSLGLKIG